MFHFLRRQSPREARFNGWIMLIWDPARALCIFRCPAMIWCGLFVKKTHGFCWFSSENATVLNHACLQPGALDGLCRQLQHIRMHCLTLTAADRRSIIATQTCQIYQLVFSLQWLGLTWRYMNWATRNGWTLHKPTPLHSAWHWQLVLTLKNACAIEKSGIAPPPLYILID